MKALVSFLFALSSLALFLFGLLCMGGDRLAQWLICVGCGVSCAAYAIDACMKIAAKGGE